MAVLNFIKLVDTGVNRSQLDSSQGYGSYQVAIELGNTNCIQVQYQSGGYGGTWTGFPRGETAYTLSYNIYIPNRADLGPTSNGVSLTSYQLPTLLSNRIYIATTVEIYNWSDIVYSIGNNIYPYNSDTNYRVRVDNFNWRIYRV